MRSLVIVHAREVWTPSANVSLSISAAICLHRDAEFAEFFLQLAFLSVLRAAAVTLPSQYSPQRRAELDALLTALLVFATQPDFRKEILPWQKRAF